MNFQRMQTLERRLRELGAGQIPPLNLPENKDPKKFVWDYTMWGYLTPTCKTAACAAGFASFLPEFQEQGLGYKILEGCFNLRSLHVTYEDEKISEWAMAKFLDIPYWLSLDIFTLAHKNRRISRSNVTPIMVADRLASVIKTYPNLSYMPVSY